MKRKKPTGDSQRKLREHTRTIQTKNGKKTIVVNPGVKKPRKKAQKPLQEKKPVTTPGIRPGNKLSKKDDEFAVLMAAALTFPTISWKGQEGAYPDNIQKRLSLDRMQQLLEDPEEFKKYATYSETLGYLSTASLDGPMQRSGAEIMQYVFAQVMPKDQWPKGLGSVPKLGPQERIELKDLREWIRKQQWKHYKQQMRK